MANAIHDRARSRLRLILSLGLVLCGNASAAERIPWTTSRIHGSPEGPPPYRVERAFPNLTFASPLDIVTIPGTDRIAIVEQRGRLFSIPNDDGCDQADLLADLKQFDPEVVESYGLAFHPQFATNRYAFVWINLNLHGKPTREEGTVIVRFRVTEENPPQLDLASGQPIFKWLGGGHNGGNLRFGPEGMLYLSTGDAASPDPPDPLGTGQNINDLLSSVLRINVDAPDPGRTYGIPKDNPFVATPGARGEVWAYGFRNPWRISFDQKNGALWLGDVGWELWEMIYRVEKGGNYGWSITEGSRQDVRPDRARGPTPILPPVVAHPHEEAASITGGEVYYGKKLPELAGAYIYGDWQLGTFWSLRTDGARVTEHRELCRSTLMPVGFGVVPDGELLICDQGGGGLWRIERNPQADHGSDFPRRLSATGLFANVVKQESAPGVVPYAVHAERWADYATGQRWIGIPGDGTVSVATKELGVMPKGRWIFPKDTVFAKTYGLDLEHGNPSTRVPIETQVLHFDGLQWAAYSYRWNEARTDAELVPTRGAESQFVVKDATAPGGSRRQNWRFFSRSECLRCHNLWDNFAPGFIAPQLHRTTASAAGNQLDLLVHLGLASDQPKMVDPHGDNGTVELRARSYLHANCSTCHRNGGGGSVPSFMNIETPLAGSRLVNARPVQGDLGLPDARVIAPGDPSRSVLLYRMATAGRGHMPYLGGRLVDDRGVILMRDWIASLRGDQDPPAGVRQQREAEEMMMKRWTSGDDSTQLDDLLASASGALSVAVGLADGSLQGVRREQAIAKGSALTDPLRRDLFERFLPDEQRRKVLGEKIEPNAVLTLKGDPGRGKELFAGLCAACHRAGDAGIDFGPDLVQAARKFDRGLLLEQILDPAKIIEPQWEQTTVALKTGETVAGFIAERTAADVVLKLAGGTTRRITAQETATITTERISSMPAGLLQGLTAQEAADLLDFISSLK